jgi:hypothetical protein
MVVSRLQNGLPNSRKAPTTSRLNCQNIFFQMRIHTFFLVIPIENFILKTTMYHKYNPKVKKKLKNNPFLETNDEHRARTYQNALHCNNQIQLAGKTNDK